ncbi:hypothetical protein [Cellvibrio mixtus]|uniref:hypothetical protein n=1 Tax=Cellvibrio mixtus TaxID=39650 RepID=UPI000586F3CB|nr:hypothetical protein [Cellvibrio mixtus]
MNEVQARMNVNFQLISTTPSASTPASKPALPDIKTDSNLHISAEAQYLFEMNKYLAGLESTERNSVLNYLSQGSDPLQRKAAEHFTQTQEQLITQEIRIQDSGGDDGRNLLNVDFVLNESTAIVARPLVADIFRLDERENFIPERRGSTQALKDQVDALEKSTSGILGAQDTANLFGSVRNALSAAENVFFSVDDVIYFNYMLEKANEAIKFFDTPGDVGSALNAILNQGVNHQKSIQTQELDQAREGINNGSFGHITRDNLRLGEAAQRYNEQFQSIIQSTGLSVFDSGGVINKLLIENTDLIRFNPEKINDALAFYQKDFEKFERALHKDFSSSGAQQLYTLDSQGLDVGRDYALKVIEQIQNYVATATRTNQ